MVKLDGELALGKAVSDNILKNSAPSLDLIYAIWHRLKKIWDKPNITVDLGWVEGHQCDKRGFESYEGFLNSIADDVKIHSCLLNSS